MTANLSTSPEPVKNGGDPLHVLDPEKVADVLMRHEFNALGQCTCGYATPDYGSGNRLRVEEKRHIAHALCEAYTEGKLSA